MRLTPRLRFVRIAVVFAGAVTHADAMLAQIVRNLERFAIRTCGHGRFSYLQ